MELFNCCTLMLMMIFWMNIKVNYCCPFYLDSNVFITMVVVIFVDVVRVAWEKIGIANLLRDFCWWSVEGDFCNFFDVICLKSWWIFSEIDDFSHKLMIFLKFDELLCNFWWIFLLKLFSNFDFISKFLQSFLIFQKTYIAHLATKLHTFFKKWVCVRLFS